MTKANLGLGVLALPSVFGVLGLVPGILIILVIQSIIACESANGLAVRWRRSCALQCRLTRGSRFHFDPGPRPSPLEGFRSHAQTVVSPSAISRSTTRRSTASLTPGAFSEAASAGSSSTSSSSFVSRGGCSGVGGEGRRRGRGQTQPARDLVIQNCCAKPLPRVTQGRAPDRGARARARGVGARSVPIPVVRSLC